jgi:hypothetical protein
MMTSFRLTSLLIVLLAPALARAQQPASTPAAAAQPPSVAQKVTAPSPTERRTIAAMRMTSGESIVLDGRLDDEIWTRTQPAGDFVQQDPDNGQPATEPTEVRIAYDENNLYIGVMCFDSDPDGWLGYQRRRDEQLPADDRFIWTIDTYLDARTAYYFEMNPSGLMGDAIQGVGNVNNRQWDGIWTGRASRSDVGWTLEIEIPFRTLNFNPGSDTWGINFQRTIRRKNEESLWSGWARNQGVRRMTNAGLLTGIRDVTQGHGLDIKPYAVATSVSSPGRGDSQFRNDGDVGVDLFYNLTPGLRANLTVNTDFAETEVDQRQVNLTRFSLFFPEKRDFFLDGSTFLDFGSGFAISGAFTPFHSRRIGLDEASGTQQRINFGGKLTGQAGNQDIGVLHVQTGQEDASPGHRTVPVAGEDFTVMRLKRRLLRQSYVGAMYTRRASRGVPIADRHTVGLDFRLETGSFLGAENLSAAGFFLHTTNPLNSGKNSAMGLELGFPNDPWSGELELSEVQTNYDAAVGFATRTGIRRISPTIAYTARPRQHPLIRRFQFANDVNWILDSDDNRMLNRDFNITAFLMELNSQDTIQFRVLPSYELLESNFSISPGITLPAGRDYSSTRYRLQATTASRRVLAVSPTVEWGGFYSGTRRRLALNLDVRVRPGVIFYSSTEWNKVDLAEGSFQTRLYRGIAETQFSPWMSLVNNVQFDTQSRILGWQSRFRWILKPGNDLYFVYLHNWLDDPLLARFATLDHRASSKLLYTHRF